MFEGPPKINLMWLPWPFLIRQNVHGIFEKLKALLSPEQYQAAQLVMDHLLTKKFVEPSSRDLGGDSSLHLLSGTTLRDNI